MLNILNYSLLSRISSGGILGQSRLFILLIYSLSVIFIDHECYFHFFLFWSQLWGLYFILLKERVLSCIKCQGGSAVLRGVFHPECTLFTCVCCHLFQSSLLNALLGELPPSQGQVSVHGRIAYVSQQPWVFPGTVKSNILFGKKYKEDRYEEVIRACALEKVSNDFWVAYTWISFF